MHELMFLFAILECSTQIDENLLTGWGWVCSKPRRWRSRLFELFIILL